MSRRITYRTYVTMGVFKSTIVLALLTFTRACEDLDAASCQSLLAQDANLCMGGVFAMNACAKTCGMCPLTCYHCDQPVSGAEQCQTTKVCNLGENCLMTSVSSTHDGHTEYRMGCATDEMCDGTAVYLGRRDISTHCCSSDLCNSPPSQVITTTPTTAATTATTTTTAAITTPGGPVCSRDILFMIEDSTNSVYDPAIKDFLVSLISSMAIGPNDNLVNLFLFDSGVNEKIPFTSTQNNTMIANAIQSLSFQHKTNTIDAADVIKHIQSVINDNHYGGDRQNAPDVVIVLSDHTSHLTQHGHGNQHSTSVNTDLSAATAVIVINVGHFTELINAFTKLATSPEYVLNLQSYSDLQLMTSQVLQLICR